MRDFRDHFVLICSVLVFCGPVVWLVSSAFGPDDWGGNWAVLTRILSAEANGPGLSRLIHVSTVLAFSVAVLSTCLSFMAAYAFVFFPMPFVAFGFWSVVATLYFPIEGRMLQTFDVAATLGMTSSFAGLILPVLHLALGTLFFRQHFKTIPSSVLEAARLDGANPLRCMFDIVAPLSWSQIATVAVVTFVSGWNQYLWPLMISVDDRHWTLIRALERVGVGSGAGLILASIALLPPLILVLILARTLARRRQFRLMG